MERESCEFLLVSRRDLMDWLTGLISYVIPRIGVFAEEFVLMGGAGDDPKG